MKELGEAINESLSDSESIAEVVARIKEGGYDIFLVLEATIGVSKQGEHTTDKESLVSTLSTNADLKISDQDLKFLKSLRIKIDDAFAVLGVPFDEGTWGQPGERYGPRDMREASQEYNHNLTEGFYYIDGDRTVLKGKRWADVGDIAIMPTVPAQTNDKVTAAVKTILAHKSVPIVSGRDHR